MLQEWLVPLEPFCLLVSVYDLPAVLPWRARATGVCSYADPYANDDEPPEEALDRLAVQQREPTMRGRLADPTLAAEKLFSPAALQNTLGQVEVVDKSVCVA